MSAPKKERPRGWTGPPHAVHYITGDSGQWEPECHVRTTRPMQPTRKPANCTFCLTMHSPTVG
jgi:hypothetical protein